MLVHLTDVCLDVLEKKKYSCPETRTFCLNLMVACAVLYDHVHATGAFVKKSPIRVCNL